MYGKDILYAIITIKMFFRWFFFIEKMDIQGIDGKIVDKIQYIYYNIHWVADANLFFRAAVS